MNNNRQRLMTIGQLAERAGVSVSAVRFYESSGLIASTRNAGNQRRFERSSIRRLSFVLIAQQLGFSLTQIKAQLDLLPSGRTPTRADWERMSRSFRSDIEQRIASLQVLRDSLTGCIGCGCLSLQRCRLYNPDDRASLLGPGARYLMGDCPESVEP